MYASFIFTFSEGDQMRTIRATKKLKSKKNVEGKDIYVDILSNLLRLYQHSCKISNSKMAIHIYEALKTGIQNKRLVTNVC